MSIDHHHGEAVSLTARARASVFSMIVFVVVAVGVALVLVTTSTDGTVPAAAPTTTTVASTEADDEPAEVGDEAEVLVDSGATSDVSVQVANSTAVSGAAGRLTDDLKSLGYVTYTPTNDTSGAAALTKVHHRDGYLLQARTLATSLGLDPEASVFPLPVDPGSNIVGFAEPELLVVVGTDLAR